MSGATGHGIEARLARLGTMDRAELTEAWIECYGNPPPPKTSQKLMIKAIAYRWQEEAFGDLSVAARRALHKIACGGASSSARALATVKSIKPGTRFVRDYHGRHIEVTASADGRFMWEGKSYPSLSAIARKVTNTRRNGPAFFGLREG